MKAVPTGGQATEFLQIKCCPRWIGIWTVVKARMIGEIKKN
jgi:hypothetical protein